MSAQTGGSFESYLVDCGLDKYFLDQSSLDIRLYHDLNIYGDVAESYIELLSEKYDVDISDFKFDEYFPTEFIGKTNVQRVMFWLFPFLRKNHLDKNEYLPFTFKKLKDSFDSKTLV